eukprot:CAMPEP_0178476036 /NCGR_PEP_ID=MMETSP0696-20121128/3423_1 /TAXON_ID=265572 /ORGANISM="Extubocellulus spinifer, Strain CCMP396" /LENGTH=77 /DNA_ID=CAMNT_0020103333 /DNA_START=50 /DNA_END=283 /DNA_ORIENTATION=-
MTASAAAGDAALLPLLRNHPSSPLVANGIASKYVGGAVHDVHAAMDIDEHCNRPHLEEEGMYRSRECNWKYVVDEVR